MNNDLLKILMESERKKRVYEEISCYLNKQSCPRKGSDDENFELDTLEKQGYLLLDAAQDLWCRASCEADLLRVEDQLRNALHHLEECAAQRSGRLVSVASIDPAEFVHLHAAVQRLGVLLLQGCAVRIRFKERVNSAKITCVIGISIAKCYERDSGLGHLWCTIEGA